MLNEEVERLLQKRNVRIVPKEAMRVRGYDLDAYRRLARRTESIDFDCGFEDGICRYREIGDKVCCSECGPSFGHWLREDGMLDEGSVKRMAGLYDAETGFWREEGGCILPRELRSPTCLYVYCSDEKMSGEDKEVLYRIHFGASWS